MAIPLTGAGGLFVRLGRIGKLLYGWNAYQAGIRTVAEALYDNYPSDYSLLGTLPASEDALMRSEGGLLAQCRQVATTTLIAMVTADVPTCRPTVYDCLVELISQMNGSTDTVERSAVAVSSSAFGTNTGDGVIRTSATGPGGLPCELLVAETAYVRCTGDSQSGTGTAGRESFLFAGEPNAAGVTDYDWPQGSAASIAFMAYDGSIDTLVSNGGFDTWSGGSPTDWTIANATESTGAYDGGSALSLTAGATGSAIQVLNDATAGNTLTPLTAYCVNFWAKSSGALGAGALRVELVDGSSTVINDAQGAANQIAIAYGSIGTSWANFGGWFRTPRVLTADIDFRIRASTAFTGGDVLIDRLSLVAPSAYAGGYGFAAFSGATKFVVGDGWTVAATNDRGGATYCATFQALFERLFGMSRMGLVLPSVAGGGETISDSLLG